MTNSSNANYSEIQYQLGLETCIPNILTSSLAVIFNSILILVLIRDPFREFRSPSTVFVANLAAADLSTGIFTMLKSVMLYLGIDLTTAIVFAYNAFYAMQCSIFTVLLITIERILAVRNPMKFKTLLTKRRCILLSLGTWFLTLFSYFSMDFNWLSTNKAAYMVHSLTNLLVICLVVLGYFYLYKLLRRKREEIARYAFPETEENSTNAAENSLRRRQRSFAENKKLVNTFLMVTVVLVVSIVPMTLVTIVMALCSKKCTEVAWYIVQKYEPIVMINFIVNPVIYAFRLPHYRKALWVVLKCAKPTNAVSPMTM